MPHLAGRRLSVNIPPVGAIADEGQPGVAPQRLHHTLARTARRLLSTGYTTAMQASSVDFVCLTAWLLSAAAAFNKVANCGNDKADNSAMHVDILNFVRPAARRRSTAAAPRSHPPLAV